MTKNSFVVEVTFKYCLSRISTSRIIKLKKCKIQFFSLSCLFSFFLIFAFKTYASLNKFLLSAQDNFYIILGSYVEGHVKKKSSLNFMSLVGFQVSKIWKFSLKTYCVASFKIICQQKQFPTTPCCWIF